MANVWAPSVEAHGYSSTNSLLVEAKDYVLRGAARSNAMPVRYCPGVEDIARSGTCWPQRF